MTPAHCVVMLGVSIAGLALADSTLLFAAAPTTKVLAEDEKVRVLDITQKPGDSGASAVRTGAIVYVLSGGMLERTFADGTKETNARKAGEAVIVKETRAYSVKNVGTTTVHLIEVLKK